MGIYRKQGGGNVAPSVIRRRSGGGWADCQFIRRRQGGTWVDAWIAYTPMSGYLSPNPASAGGLTIPAVYVALSLWNGRPGYSYNWWLTTTSTGGSGTAKLVNPDGSGASIQGSANKTSGGFWNGTVFCTITDATGNAITVAATVNLSMTKASGGQQ